MIEKGRMNALGDGKEIRNSVFRFEMYVKHPSRETRYYFESVDLQFEVVLSWR